ncbi:MAG: Ig-like domain-containing protein [Pirellulales bacterium]
MMGNRPQSQGAFEGAESDNGERRGQRRRNRRAGRRYLSCESLEVRDVLAGLGPLGDFNQDGVVEATDVDLLTVAYWQGQLDESWDFNGDGQADLGDRDYLVHRLLQLIPGSLDDDTDVDSADLLVLVENWTGQLQPGTGQSRFTGGDLDGDLDLDTNDLLSFLANWTGSLSQPFPSGPTVTGIADQVRFEDRGVGSFAFQVSDSDTPLDELTITARSSNSALIPADKIQLEGTGRYHSITLNSLKNAYGSTRITIRVSDGKNSTETSFDVDVLPVNDPPITVAMPDVQVDASEGKVVIDLFAAFQDVEDADSQMTYAVRSNTNAQLFQSADIDQQTGKLTLTLAPGSSGVADITLLATDSGGLSVSLDPSATDVTVYDRIRVDGLVSPSLGLKPLDLWTDWFLFDRVNDQYVHDQIDAPRLIRNVQDPELVKPGVPIVFNIELPNFGNDPSGRDNLAEVFYLAQKYAANQDFGIYRILPETNWHAIYRWAMLQYDAARNLDSWFTRAEGEIKREYLAYQQRNSDFRTLPVSAEFGGKSLAELVDTINPSLYTRYRNWEPANLRDYRHVDVDTDTDRLTVSDGTSYEQIQRVGLTVTREGNLPKGLSLWNPYYVVNADGASFQISETPGGPPIDIVPGMIGEMFAATTGPWVDPLMDPDVIGWRTVAAGTIADARMFGKPVNAWISPSIDAIGNTYLEKDFFRMQLDYLATLADGIVVYDMVGLDAAFHRQQGWWSALQEFMDDHRLVMPEFRVTVTGGQPLVQLTAVDDQLVADQDIPLKITGDMVLANDDLDGNANVYAAIYRSPEHGHLKLDADGFWTYVPDVAYFGADSFEYRFAAQSAESNVARVNLVVRQKSIDPPLTLLARDDQFTVTSGSTLQVGLPGLLANDQAPDQQSLTVRLVSGPGYGTLTLNSDGSFDYSVGDRFVGEDTFSYEAVDEQGGSSLAVVTIVVSPAATPVLESELTASAVDAALSLPS